MCGIYISNIISEESLAVNNLKKISYRGPDNLSVEKHEDIIIGHLRLSIIDTKSRSNQPFHYNNFILTFNGEIYNFEEVREELKEFHEFKTNSDTEVLIVGYSIWGEKILDKINGMFSFAIYDKNTKDIFAARDRLGVKPFYYYYDLGKFEICSQLQPFSVHKKISKKSLSIYYDLGYVPSPYSIFENINKLKPGHFLKINSLNNSITIVKYWDLEKTKIIKNKNESLNLIEKLIKDAVDIRLKCDVAMGAFLSGGVDSSIVSLYASKTKKKLETYTIGFEEVNFDESVSAQNISRQIGLKNNISICKEEKMFNQIENLFTIYDEPFADSSAIPSLQVNELVKNDVTVVLTGDGGDESFFGYNHFKWLKYVNFIFIIFPLFIRKIISNFLKIINKLINHKRLFFIHKILILKNIDDFIVTIFCGFDRLSISKCDDWFNDNYKEYLNLSDNIYQKAADLNIKLWLENDSNVKTDRASMGNSIELRSPFLDFKLIKGLRNVKYSLRKNKLPLRNILKNNNIISNSFTNKKGFSVPMKKWINGPLKDDVLEHLNDCFIDSLPDFDGTKFKIMLEEHYNDKNDYTYFIWRVYVLSKWVTKNGIKF